MFDIGFSELLLIAVVALLVLGPERLPRAARLAGLWIRKARAQWNAVKAELENEIADEELRRNLREASDAMREGVQQVRTLPSALRDDPPATPVAAAIEPAHAASTLAEPARDANANENIAATQHDHDPAQLSLLDPDLALTQLTALPPSCSRSDG